MANPYLVIGGIAVSIATAGFGILMVPGWVAAAQDAAAVNDVSQVTQAQSLAKSVRGTYLDSIQRLNDVGSVKMAASQSTHSYTAVDWTGEHSVALSRSASGMFFARLSGHVEIGSGETVSDAVTAAGTTVDEGITAEGIQLPLDWRDGWVVPHNFAVSPLGDSLAGHIATLNADLSLVDDFPGSVNTAIRSAQLDVTEGNTVRWLEMRVGEKMPFGESIRFTATVRLSEPAHIDFSARSRTGHPDSAAMADVRRFLPAGVSRVDVTLDTKAIPSTPETGLTLRGNLVGSGFTLDITQMALTVSGVNDIVP